MNHAEKRLADTAVRVLYIDSEQLPKLIEIARAGRAELRSLFEQDRR